MSYKINYITIRDDKLTINTNVTYFLSDNSEITLDVDHFAPNSINEILDGIENREKSEQYKIDTPKKVQIVFQELQTYLKQ